MNIKTQLEKELGANSGLCFNDIDIYPIGIKAIMINEVVPSNPTQDFYGQANADYMKTTIPLFPKAGLDFFLIQDILQRGIYITNAVKTPKTEYSIEKSVIEKSLPLSE